MSGAKRSAERGAALVIVLLLVATLSFIALAISERTALSANRAVNARSRSELLWLGLGAEALARGAIKASLGADKSAMTPESALFAKPAELPIEGGGAIMTFADRTRCFNVNSLVAKGSNEQAVPNSSAVEEFKVLMDEKAVSSAMGDAVIAAIIDWIDEDANQQPRGAEDGYYVGLPAPYRTGGTRLADASEVRAMSGAERDIYRAIRPYICAQPNEDGSPVNINMLTADDAPILSALTQGQISEQEAASIIQDRPPGGYESVEAFWAQPAFSGKTIDETMRGRVKLTSRYIEAYAVMNFGAASANLSMLFEVPDSGAPRLVSRRIERFD
ncbi:MAG: type II secretion system minor pseudopilin GspK [Parvularculaceae bacterium]